MAEVTVAIGGRGFQVVCQEGQEEYLHSAAAMLNTEAMKLDQTNSRVTESRLLLMAGLMLADKTAALEEQLSQGNAAASAEAVEEERAKTRHVQAELDQSRQDIVALKSAMLDMRAQLDHAAVNNSGGAELETARAEVEVLNQRVVELQDANRAALEQASGASPELDAVTSARDDAISKMDEAAALQTQAENDRDEAVEALKRVVEQLEIAAV